ncbi:MAG: methyltransferase domain-containing protein [Candidatus Micrarchaeota archaeon]|nr:methyltransferase domain-containing protein [Candidatus Micrarchaeota archaeon]
MDSSCIVCNGKELHKVLDLGRIPNSNELVPYEALGKVDAFPLEYYTCGNCGMFQQIEIRSRESLFSSYLYLTGVNRPLVEHFREMSEELSKIVVKRSLAYVLGSNDGTEVTLLKAAGFGNVVGVEPSNVAKIAQEKGIETINSFFTHELSEEMVKKYGKADLVTANNVFAHIPDPKDMLKGMANLIADDGTISIEVHWLKSIVDKLEIETLYTEHYFVWPIRAMKNISAQAGLEIQQILYMPEQHGGSLRFILRKVGRGKRDSGLSGEMARLDKMEAESGLYDLRVMGKLQTRANERKLAFVSLIRGLKKDRKRISIWSVPAKVPTLLNFCGITNKEIDCAYDIAKTKIGRYIPMANIEIKDEKLIEADNPDYLIIGAWNYMDLALEKFGNYMKGGGRLINPLNCEIIGDVKT